MVTLCRILERSTGAVSGTAGLHCNPHFGGLDMRCSNIAPKTTREREYVQCSGRRAVVTRWGSPPLQRRKRSHCQNRSPWHCWWQRRCRTPTIVAGGARCGRRRCCVARAVRRSAAGGSGVAARASDNNAAFRNALPPAPRSRLMSRCCSRRKAHQSGTPTARRLREERSLLVGALQKDFGGRSPSGSHEPGHSRFPAHAGPPSAEADRERAP
jgi:hypothetical protein